MQTGQPVQRQPSIAPATSMGRVALRVSDLGRSRTFYQQVLGLTTSEVADGVVLAAAGDRPLVELHGDSSATPLDRSAPGLFHQALLMPDRPSLAIALARVARARWPLSGASDHLVSEALYLSDPDGNGIEIYRDRPREDWPRQDGQLSMSTLPLDLDDLIAELPPDGQLEPQAPRGTRMGHVHLQVADLKAAEDFYAGALGFDVTVRGYPGALFVSAGGYHHHLGLNTWHSEGAPPREPGSVGLEWFEILAPTEEEVRRLTEQVRGAGADVQALEAGWLTSDPSGNRVLLRAA